MVISVRFGQKDVFLGQIWRHRSKLDTIWPKLFFKRFNALNWTTFSPTVLAKTAFKTVKTDHFCRIWPNRRIFGPKKDVICQKWRKLRKKFFFKMFHLTIWTTFSPTVLPKNAFKRVKKAKNCQNRPFYYISYIKCLYKGLILKILETTPLPTTFGQKIWFSSHSRHPSR